MDLKSEIMRRIDSLPPSLQQKLLETLDAFENSPIRGEKGSKLLPFSGTLDNDAAAEMKQAIEEGCETIDAAEW
jgi:hypothetical protein